MYCDTGIYGDVQLHIAIAKEFRISLLLILIRANMWGMPGNKGASDEKTTPSIKEKELFER